MWKAEFRAMTLEERTELDRMLTWVLLPSWREVVGGFWGRLFRADPRSDAGLREALRRDLQKGKVQVIHVTAGEAVRLRNSDGTLAGFFVDIGGNLVMFVEPREWESPGAASDFERLFPCTTFSLIRAPRSGVDLDFICDGRRFEPTRELEAPPGGSLEALLKDGEIFPARLNTLEEDLERLLAQSSPGSASREAVGGL